MAEPIPFACCYCNFEMAAAPEQAECMLECPGCGRSVLVPRHPRRVEWPAPPPPRTSSWMTSAFVAIIMGVLGGFLGAGLCFGAGYFVYLNWIGFDLLHAVIAGAVGWLAGMFCFGLLGWNISTR